MSVCHICTFSDPQDYRIQINGHTHRFDWSDRFGPLFLGKDGRDLKNQNQQKLVWDALGQWSKQGKRLCANGFAIWRPESSDVPYWIFPRVGIMTRLQVLQSDRCCQAAISTTDQKTIPGGIIR